MKDKTDTLGDRESCPEWLVQYMSDADHRSSQSRSTWKTILFQAQSTYLAICVPLVLGQVPPGAARTHLLSSSLLAALSLPLGLWSLRSESDREGRRLSRNRKAIDQSKVYVTDPQTTTERLADRLFLLISNLSYLYLLVVLLFVALGH